VLVCESIEAKDKLAALVCAAQNGDRAAFGTLYERYARMIHGILLSHVSFADAEDLVQDVFIRAMQQLRSLHDPAAFGSWVAAIARRSATDLHRKQRTGREARDRTEHPRPGQDGSAILAELQKLPKAYRETLVLRLVEGMTGPEIALRTGLAPDSVRVNLCRGMKLLREALGGPGRK
jgi:RNA polymerase sigma-70 factor (ECF subfamily)